MTTPIRRGFHLAKKKPQLRGLRDTLLLIGAGYCQMLNHSHSMVYEPSNILLLQSFTQTIFRRYRSQYRQNDEIRYKSYCYDDLLTRYLDSDYCRTTRI